MSSVHLPTELLREIVQYLRPYNEHEPITGLNAIWKPFSKFQESLRARSRPSEKKPESITNSMREMIISYQALIALRSTCSLMREICAPILYENLNLLDPITDFEGYYSSVLVPNAAHVRNIRMLLDNVTAEVYVKCLNTCKNATSLAIYSNYSKKSFHSIELTHPLCQAVIKMLKEGNLNALGIYSPWIIHSIRHNWPREGSTCSLLKHILENSDNIQLIKYIDLASMNSLRGGPYDYVRTKLPSLEALAITGLLSSSADDIWPPNGGRHWAPYPNLKRLQLRGCKAVYANRIPLLVRHFPSLTHVLFSSHRENKNAEDLRTEDWYDREDALWKVRKPLETLHLEYVVGGEVLAMGEIPVKTLIITNSPGKDLIGAMDGEKEDARIFPGLQSIRIQPQFGRKFDLFGEESLPALKEICLQREIMLTRDAEGTTQRL